MFKKIFDRKIFSLIFIILPLLLSCFVFVKYYKFATDKCSIEDALNNYPLTTEATCWEIVHAIVAFGKDFKLLDEGNKKEISAVDFLCTQREVFLNKELKPVIVVNLEYPEFIETRGYGIVQGHKGQFLAKLLSSGVSLNQSVNLYTKQYTLKDMLNGLLVSIDLEKLKEKAPPMTNVNSRDFELGWIVEALSYAVKKKDVVWENKDKAFEILMQLLDIMVQRPLGWGSCAGTHELDGMAISLANYLEDGGKLGGVWIKVKEKLDLAKSVVKKKQNWDGSYDSRWTIISQPPMYMDNWRFQNEKIYVTGHMLVWLSKSLDGSEWKKPFVKKAYKFLKKSRVKKEDVISSYGSFCHAVEAMSDYEDVKPGFCNRKRNSP